MNIYNPDGSILIENVPITSNAKHYEEMMKSNYIKLSWNDNTYRTLPTGAYIEWNHVRYKLFSDYQPTTKDEIKCVYEPEFQHPMMILDHTPCLLVTHNSQGDEIKEPTWTYTGSLQLIAGRLQTIIMEELGVVLDTQVNISDNSLAASATVSFDGDTIWSAFSKVCQAWENDIEFHVVWNITRGTSESVNGCIYFGDIAIDSEEWGGAATLTDGVNCVTTSRQENNKNEYANYFNVRGGTRNIAIVTASGDNVQTDTRMTLNTTTYPNSVIDKRESDYVPKIQETLIFDDVYPSLTLYCYNIRERVRRRQDEDGNYIVKEYNDDGSVKSYKTYSVYYLRLGYPVKDESGNVKEWKEFSFDKNADMIDGKTLMCSFQANEKGSHSALAGRDFEMRYHTVDRTIPASTAKGDSGVSILKGDWEIVFEEEDDFIIPNSDTLAPYGETTPSEQCDTLLLYNILLTGDYLTNAQNKLEAYALEEIERRMTDYDNYTVKSYPHIFKKSNPNLFVGQKVYYTNREGSLTSHVIKIETNLDCEYVQTITLGNAKITGTITSVKDDVKAMSGVIDVNTSSVNSVTRALAHIMSQIREWAENFLSRKEDDSAEGHITFLKGVTIDDGSETTGVAKFNNNVVAKQGMTIAGLFKFDLLGNIVAHTIKSSDVSDSKTGATDPDDHADKKGWTVAVKDSKTGTYKLLIDELRAWSKATIGNIVIEDDVKTKKFIPGFLTGTGWGITSREVTNAAGVDETKWTGEFDDLVVRGSMKVYEMVVSQLVGENDNRIFTGMLEVAYYDEASGKVYLSLENENTYNPFRTDDYILVQQFNPSGYDVTKSYELIITEYGSETVNNTPYAWVKFKNFTTGVADGTAASLISEGDTFVRVDNLSDPDRKGIVQIITVGTSTPHIDVIQNLKTDPDNSLKARLGNLDKISDPQFGNLSGFGLYSNNAYLTGDFVIKQTGEKISSKFEVLADKFASQYTAIENEMTKGENLLTNGNLLIPDDAETDSESVPASWNADGMATLEMQSVDDKKVLVFAASSGLSELYQDSKYIKSVPTHKVYNADGTTSYAENDVTLTIKFKPTDNTELLEVSYYSDTSSLKLDALANKGSADEKGWYTASTVIKNFDAAETVTITLGGMGYIEYIRITDNEAQGMQTTLDSAITQTSESIKLQTQKIDANTEAVAAIEVKADSITNTVSNLKLSPTDNLFGLTKGITLTSAGTMYFYAQAYGIFCCGANEYTLGNLKLKGNGGNFVITAEVYQNQVDVFTLGAKICGIDADNNAKVPINQWTAVRFNVKDVVDANDDNMTFVDVQGTKINLSFRHLCILRGEVSTASLVVCNDDLQSYDNDYEITEWGTVSGVGTEENVTIDNKSMTVYSCACPANGSYVDALYHNSITPAADREVYTLSFWAKADNAETRIISYLYGNESNPPGTGQAYTDDLGDGAKQSVQNASDGATNIFLTTEWKKYYIRWKTINNKSFNVIPFRINNTANEGYTGNVYMAGATLKRGYICEENGAGASTYSTIKQTADGIELKVKNTGIDIEEGKIDMTADKFTLKNPKTKAVVLSADSDGNLSMTGKVTATSGKIGNFELCNSNLRAQDSEGNTIAINNNEICFREGSYTNDKSYLRFWKNYGWSITWHNSMYSDAGTQDVSIGQAKDDYTSFGVYLGNVYTDAGGSERQRRCNLTCSGFSVTDGYTSGSSGGTVTSLMGYASPGGFVGINADDGMCVVGYNEKTQETYIKFIYLPSVDAENNNDATYKALESGQVYKHNGYLKIK